MHSSFVVAFILGNEVAATSGSSLQTTIAVYCAIKAIHGVTAVTIHLETRSLLSRKSVAEKYFDFTLHLYFDLGSANHVSPPITNFRIKQLSFFIPDLP